MLGVLAWWEDRRLGPRSRRDRALAAVAGVFFAADLICWHHAIEDVGAGLATVLGNLQVAFVGLVAWLVLGERPAARLLATLPLVLVGVVLISGVLEQSAYGADPTQGVDLRPGHGARLHRLHPGTAGRQRRAAARRGPAVRRHARRGTRLHGGRDPDRRRRPRPVVAGARVAGDRSP